ncbi:translocation/assembly module TamB domain-containing protein [Geomonas subterranea]|uniref:Translocation/assembly module TamB domain-containing protein n=1 Tax=Geomonas subterranea TaxID=2847989 RepID=A0ABX8LQH1_9BACT|nr:translocation/assembly module TamB domain-containing protein [Geomonas subterranea]QXE92965.1 translocation/assembly module TamB domain-containing protein [Geomonas subterranea]QXM08929.1 translocation/assembly module TamB domain-containing protein [Geomonas subterranea]
MRRLALYIGLPVLGLVIAPAAGLFWLLDTSSGARFAVTTVGGLSGATVSVRQVEGRLWDRLRLTGVRLDRSKVVVQLERLDLSWEPVRLLHGKLLVHDLSLTALRIQDDTPLAAKAPELRWPQVSQTVGRLEARVERFSLKGMSYRHFQGEPFLLSELTAGLAMRDGVTTMSGGSVSAAQGSASGEVTAGLLRPSLRLDLRLAPSRPVSDMDAFAVNAHLEPGREPEQLAGPVALTGSRGAARRLEIASDLGVTRTGFNFRNFRLLRPGRRGTLTGNGSMTLTKEEPLFALALKAGDLDLEREFNHPVLINGELTFSGSPARYLGTFNLTNRGPGWESMGLAARYRGDKNGMRLDPLSGKWLKGSVRGALDVDWSRGWRVSGKLSGRGLDPEALAAEWKGVVNLDLTGSVGQRDHGAVGGSVQARLLQSRLKGHDLTGELEGSFSGPQLAVKRLLLAGKGFRFRGSGEPGRRFDFAADVTDLSGVLPGSAGSATAEGWLRWREGMLSGTAAATGRELAVDGVRAGAVELRASLGEGKDHPVSLRGTAREVRSGPVAVDAASFALRGTSMRHTVEAQLASGVANVEFLASGGYADGTWRGELSRFSGNDGVGPFSLAAPARLTVGQGRFSTTPLVIGGAPGERVELAGNMNRDRSGAFSGSWSGLNLARADVWLPKGELSGASSGSFDLRLARGGRATLNAYAEASGAVVTGGKRVGLSRLVATVRGGEGGIDAGADLALENGSGNARLAFHSDEPAALALPRRGDLTLNWTDLDLALLRPYLSPELTLEGRLAGEVKGRLLPGRRMDLSGTTALGGGRVIWRGKGDEFDASIDHAEVSFERREAGKAGAKLVLHGSADATGAYRSKGEKVIGSQFTLRADADDKGTRASADLWLDTGGSLRAALSSDSPAGTTLPETGDFSIEWSDIKPALLRPWLPGAMDLQGELHGSAKGRLLPGKRLEIAGQAGFSQGSARWQGSTGEASAAIRSALLNFDWRGESLTGNLDLFLADYGEAKGDFLLPVPARLPVVPNQEGGVRGALSGKLQEHGFLTAFFPGLVQETRGTLTVDVKAGGTWGDPTANGTLELADAGAYLPSAGITLTGVQLLARLERDEMRIERLRALSGGGELVGNLLMRLKGWRVLDYRGTLSGQRFQTVYLPELTMYTSPQLTIEGDAGKATVNGEIGVPEMLITGPPTQHVVATSEDVVFEGAPPKGRDTGKPLLLEGKVKVVLGDKVRVEASGIDAQLGGSMDLVLNGIDKIESSGEIKVVKGRYRAYGMDLEIVRGRIYYVNAPVTRPTLDVLALRTVGDVKAGVTVGGFLNAPVVKLYSEPAMPEVDILAYMVLGHAMGTSGEQGGALATAAAGLFSFGKSESLQEQIKDRLGLSTLGLERVDTSSTGRMGYKEIATTPTGAISAKAPAAGESVFSVGKYLTPKLYLNYGRSLITGQNLFRLRYDVFKRMQIETQSGSESGVDVYYKLEFR